MPLLGYIDWISVNLSWTSRLFFCTFTTLQKSNDSMLQQSMSCNKEV